MSDQIVSIEMIRAKARAAFERGVGREHHEFNWNAPAIPTWQEEWDRCAAARAQQHAQVAEP